MCFTCVVLPALHALLVLVLMLAGRFIAGQTCLVLWSTWAWGQRSVSAAAVANTNSKLGAGPAATTAADPFISLLLAALPLTAEQHAMAAILLPAALYEGLFGAAAVALLSGRWVAWLLLWETWLWCCYVNCRSSRCSQEEMMAGEGNAAAAAVYDRGLTCRLGQQQLGARQKLSSYSSSSSSSSSTKAALLVLLSRPIMLAAAQLMLPVCMAVVAVWR
jgi:hypothetical protein